MKKLVCIIISFAFLMSCVKKPNTGNTATPTPQAVKPVVVQQPKMTVDKNKPIFRPRPKLKRKGHPNKQGWVFEKHISVENFKPSGICNIKDRIFVSDPSQSLLLHISLETGLIVDTVSSDIKNLYLNQRTSSLLVPDYASHRVVAFRGEKKPHIMDVKETLLIPTFFEGERVDNYYLVDQGNNRVIRNFYGKYTIIGKKGSGDGEFNKPTAVANANDNIYVVDSGNKRIQQFDLDGVYIGSFGQAEGLQEPTGITTDHQQVFVCDAKTSGIYVYDSNGTFLYKIDKNINMPSDLFFDGDQLIVANQQGPDVSIFKHAFYNDKSILIN